MLWVNLIMDILGAIALGTEPYDPDLQGTRISRKEKIIIPAMWRQILLHALYQIVVMCVLMFMG